MTAEEAIKTIQVAIAEVEWDYPLDYSTAFKTAIEALDKQIPKKPVVVGEEYIFERDEWEKDYECPFCGNPYADDSFCSCCGQKLDWSDNNG